jgi:CDP-diacylglycerol---serine O-phosphatidyltransferase
MNLRWIPNILTMGNLTCGFMSVIFASFNSSEGYIVAAVLILVAALLDGLDGPIARFLGVSSPIGKELDSLADSVAFGVAPGYLAYATYLSGTNIFLLGRSIDLGVPIAAIFPACAAYRLARFNVQSSPDSFTGLPSPIAGMLVALALICFRSVEIPKPLFATTFSLVGFLMVSTVRYAKAQPFILKNLHGFKLAGLMILLVLLLILFKFWVIFLFIGLYILSGLLTFAIHFIEDHRY